jgi:hypothetical protein
MSERATKADYYKKLFFNDSVSEPSPVAVPVLKDLEEFCGAKRSGVLVNQQSGNIDPLAMAVLQGRREVWLRVQAMLESKDSLTDKEQNYATE